ncbi:HD domain-containing phosphohydrolase [Pelomonas sp. KK5]|uniref:HD domain-containing phosphohydrolase n=1 Tax=Pelomonas sp. KK5 TaxID=1855730 RepID=UPI001E59F454|nr:HD domain-containing phosphohydrolase [Pelomonas sp. KK5]
MNALVQDMGAAAAALAPAAPQAWTILLVDDEPNIISSLRRLLRGEEAFDYKVLGAGGGAEALALLESTPVDLIISDMRMPGMNGAEFLEQALHRFPEAGRLLLTGEADIRSTMDAINKGEIYRYITKPWNDEELLLTVRQAIERKQLQRERQALLALTQAQNEQLAGMNARLEEKVAERTAQLSSANERLGRNYLASVKAFSGLIELRNASLVGHARRVADVARRTAQQMGLPEEKQREVFVAGLLHDIGQIGLNDTVLGKPMPKLNGEELAAYRRHPTMGEQALLALDDMHAVSILIRHHHERHDGQGFPDKLAGDALPLGAAILAVADAYDDLQIGHLGSVKLNKDEARTILEHGRGTIYNPQVIDAFLELTKPAPPPPPAAPPVPRSTAQLQPGMVLAKELVSREGVVLLTAGHALTADLIERIRSYEQRDGLNLVLMIKA